MKKTNKMSNMRKLLMTMIAVGLMGGTALAGSMDLGARYGRVPSESGSTSELFVRYRPTPIVSLGASIGSSELEYTNNGQTKRIESTPIGAQLTVHVPFIPFIKPYAGAGVQLYTNRTVTSNGSDLSKERSSTATLQVGADLFAPFPGLSFNIEARRLVGDEKTQILGGALMSF